MADSDARDGKPGIDARCLESFDCPKAGDPAGISWAAGCWCYRNQFSDGSETRVKVWVIYSDCGLNGPWIHAVRSTKPTETPEELRRMYAERPEGGGLCGGYHYTYAEEWEVDGAESRNTG